MLITYIKDYSFAFTFIIQILTSLSSQYRSVVEEEDNYDLT